ncbi:hypothetical protein BV25DRAFT_1994841 [Artomyces pyxidatus]|uniref:Uncharacterized protein n=1 Tax=Artomyces pyxidatus TaxID=48021 RepID=A0ACB8SM83_9AGAM|nr:hypothetical protein BV25DRAFT_1994841 [Artomyces pyxidatus]
MLWEVAPASADRLALVNLLAPSRHICIPLTVLMPVLRSTANNAPSAEAFPDLEDDETDDYTYTLNHLFIYAYLRRNEETAEYGLLCHTFHERCGHIVVRDPQTHRRRGILASIPQGAFVSGSAIEPRIRDRKKYPDIVDVFISKPMAPSTNDATPLQPRVGLEFWVEVKRVYSYGSPNLTLEQWAGAEGLAIAQAEFFKHVRQMRGQALYAFHHYPKSKLFPGFLIQGAFFSFIDFKHPGSTKNKVSTSRGRSDQTQFELSVFSGPPDIEIRYFLKPLLSPPGPGGIRTLSGAFRQALDDAMRHHELLHLRPSGANYAPRPNNVDRPSEAEIAKWQRQVKDAFTADEQLMRAEQDAGTGPGWDDTPKKRGALSQDERAYRGSKAQAGAGPSVVTRQAARTLKEAAQAMLLAQETAAQAEAAQEQLVAIIDQLTSPQPMQPLADAEPLEEREVEAMLTLGEIVSTTQLAREEQSVAGPSVVVNRSLVESAVGSPLSVYLSARARTGRPRVAQSPVSPLEGKGKDMKGKGKQRDHLGPSVD